MSRYYSVVSRGIYYIMEIMVSILTTAYNHAPYISEALNSFLMQKTSFSFEVIVHDDASTDGTTEIIREYANRYPQIIHPIFQTENQYSKGINIYDLMLSVAQGKYLAQCEGDDYWCDCEKLQKQTEYMENHPECSFCFCNSYNVDLNSQIIKKVSPVEKSRILSSREMISKPEVFLATAGTMYRRADLSAYPKDLTAGEAGDIPLRNYLMLHGNAYGFADYMVCYRVMVPGSWSDRYEKDNKNNPENFLRKNELYLDYYIRFDKYTNGLYHQELLPHIHARQFIGYQIKSDWPALHKPPFISMFKQLPFKQQLIVFVKYYFPWFVKAFRLLRYGKKGLEKKY